MVCGAPTLVVVDGGERSCNGDASSRGGTAQRRRRRRRRTTHSCRPRRRRPPTALPFVLVVTSTARAAGAAAARGDAPPGATYCHRPSRPRSMPSLRRRLCRRSSRRRPPRRCRTGRSLPAPAAGLSNQAGAAGAAAAEQSGVAAGAQPLAPVPPLPNSRPLRCPHPLASWTVQVGVEHKGIKAIADEQATRADQVGDGEGRRAQPAGRRRLLPGDRRRRRRPGRWDPFRCAGRRLRGPGAPRADARAGGECSGGERRTEHGAAGKALGADSLFAAACFGFPRSERLRCSGFG